MHKAEGFQIISEDKTKISATLFSGDAKSAHLIIVSPAAGAPSATTKGLQTTHANTKDLMLSLLTIGG